MKVDAFDFDLLEHKTVVVRQAAPGETLVTLDGERRPVWTKSPEGVPSPSASFATSGARPVPFIAASADFAQEKFGAASVLAAKVDPETLAAETPEAQKAQVYAASLMTIRVDTDAEAEYLDRLAKAMGLSELVVNQLHMQMGLQPLYS